MGLGSPKSMSSYPKTLLPIATSVGGLALFLIFASWILVYQPIGSKVSGYFYNLDEASKIGLPPFNKETGVFQIQVNDTEIDRKIVDSATDKTIDLDTNKTVDSDVNQTVESDVNKDSDINKTTDSDINKTVDSDVNQTVDSDVNKDSDINNNADSDARKIIDPDINKPVDLDINKTMDVSTKKTADSDTKKSVESGCDLYDGKWVHDSLGPLYTNNSCPLITQHQNCQGNGRPDKDYENWRWKPTKCDLPRFDPKKFLELIRGKTLAFVGDSVARNQMESMLCILWQVEVPKNRGNKRMQRYYFQSQSVTIIRIWSSWLVHKTTEKFDFAPEGVDKLHLDIPDETFVNDVPHFDILVLSSGHWFAKKSVYILNNEIVGGQLWWPDKNREKIIESPDAFKISVQTIMSALVTSPGYAGLVVVRSWSPDHYEGGAWNTGGSCTGKVSPASDLVENGFTNTMHEKQVLGFGDGVRNKTNKARVVLMDITRMFGYRHDGHPGPYRNLDPNKVVKRSADGRPPPQDCLHWCMPGPVDTWNELLVEVIRRDSEGVN